MLRYAHALWDAFFPTKPVYPVLLAGHGDAHAIEDTDALEAQLRRRYRVFTYRDAFEGLLADYRTVHTDQGWGCLLRTTQMLLAHFLLRYADADVLCDGTPHRDAHDSRSSSCCRRGDCHDVEHRVSCASPCSSPTPAAVRSEDVTADDDDDDDNVCFPWRLFCDCSSAASPFSLHNMVHSVYGERAFRPEYWSPSQGCEALRRTVHAAVRAGALRTRVTVLVASNGCIFHADVVHALRTAAAPHARRVREGGRCRHRRAVATAAAAAAAAAAPAAAADECARVRSEAKEHTTSSTTPAEGAGAVVLLLTPVRVSAAPQLTQEAYLQLERLLEQPACLGMVGGVPSRSYFFFAHNQTQLLYLDPHQSTQPALHSGSDAAVVGRQLVPTRDDVRCVHWSRVDTSLFLAFALRDVREWRQLRERLRGVSFLHIDDSVSAHTARTRTAAAAATVCALSSSSSSSSSSHEEDEVLCELRTRDVNKAANRAAVERVTQDDGDGDTDEMAACANDSWHMLDDSCTRRRTCR